MDITPIEQVKVSAYSVPTESPESDGTLEWNLTTLALELKAYSQWGIPMPMFDLSPATTHFTRNGFLAGPLWIAKYDQRAAMKLVPSIFNPFEAPQNQDADKHPNHTQK